VNTREGNQISLEFVQVDVQAAIETEGGSDTRHDLSDQPVEVGEAGGRNTKVLLADIVNCFVINHERAVGVFESGMCREHGVVGLNNGVGHLGCGVYAEFEFGFFAVVGSETVKEKSTESGTSSTTKCMEDKEALETRAVVRKASNLVSNGVNDFLADSVMTTSIIARSILLAGDQGFGVEECPVGTSPNLVDDIGFKIDVKGTGNVFATSRLRKESRKPAIVLRWRSFDDTAVRTQAVLEGVEFPASVTDLDTSLTDVKGNDFSHFEMA